MIPILVTVSGNRSNILQHQLKYYKTFVKDAVVFINDSAYSNRDINDKSYDDAVALGAKTYRVDNDHRFNATQVTNVINYYRSKYPKEWFIIADDDEFQSYNDDLPSIIDYCLAHGHKFVTGGFVDRIGADGHLSEIREDSDIWSLFPYAGFYRYPSCKACPHKITLASGNLQVSGGQHFAAIDRKAILARYAGHKLRYPVDRTFTQVHHFKWDNTVADRLLAVTLAKDRQYGEECMTQYEALKANGFCIDVTKPNYYCQYSPTAKYDSYKHWPQVSAIMLNI